MPDRKSSATSHCVVGYGRPPKASQFAAGKRAIRSDARKAAARSRQSCWNAILDCSARRDFVLERPPIDPELTIRMLLVGYCLGVRSERRLQYTYVGANKSSAMIAMRFILFAHRGNCYVRITEPSPFFGFEEANTKDLAPCGEGLVCGDQQRSPFVSRADEFEERGTRRPRTRGHRAEH